MQSFAISPRDGFPCHAATNAKAAEVASPDMTLLRIWWLVYRTEGWRVCGSLSGTLHPLRKLGMAIGERDWKILIQSPNPIWEFATSDRPCPFLFQ